MEYEYVKTQDTREKQENEKRKRANGRGGAPAVVHHPAAVELSWRPALKKEESAPTWLADHTLVLQWHS